MLTIQPVTAPQFDTHGYVWFARVGAFVFIVMQQIILIDTAYTLNHKLVVSCTLS